MLVRLMTVIWRGTELELGMRFLLPYKHKQKMNPFIHKPLKCNLCPPIIVYLQKDLSHCIVD